MKSTGYIINGVYKKHTESTDPISAGCAAQLESITYKAYSHDRQREEHRRDLIQPYQHGKPNPEFIEQYPEEAQNYGFNQTPH